MSGRKDWPIDDVEGLISKIREAKKELESRQFSSDDYGKSFKEDSEEIITAARSMLRQLGVEDELDA
ncbi:MAG: hypothetical protein U5K77_00395 [Candidatus Saccharibacteria bacterium]|nr:hypothetical protein [Candidatus Saccharibacteria bacterium]